MTLLQRKFVESRLAIVALFVAVTLLQEHPWLARGAFIPVGLYLIANLATLKEIELTGPSPLATLASSAPARYWGLTCVILETATAYYFIFSGRDLGEYLNSFGSLALAFLLPTMPAVYLNQRDMFRRLRDARL